MWVVEKNQEKSGEKGTIRGEERANGRDDRQAAP